MGFSGGKRQKLQSTTPSCKI